MLAMTPPKLIPHTQLISMAMSLEIELKYVAHKGKGVIYLKQAIASIDFKRILK